MGEAYEVRSKEVLGDNCRWAVDYCVNLDNSEANRSVNTMVRTGRLDRPRIGRSHRLLDIVCRDIYNGLCPSDVGLVEIQAQHRPDRLRKPRTESVGTDRIGRFCVENRDDAMTRRKIFREEYILGLV